MMPVSDLRECFQCRHIAPTTLCACLAKVIQVLQKPATLGSPIDISGSGSRSNLRDRPGTIFAGISANSTEHFDKR